MRARWRDVGSYSFFIVVALATALALAWPLGPDRREQPGWRGALARLVHRRLAVPVGRAVRALYRVTLGRLLSPVLGRVLGRVGRSRQPAPPDPFVVLALQTRLGAVADEIRALEFDGRVYARAARLEARSAAYDALLREACELTGVDLEQEETRRSGERMRRELELASRGWSW